MARVTTRKAIIEATPDDAVRTPVVLAHGIFGVGNVGVGRMRFSYFHRIDRAITGRGHPLLAPRVHPTGGIRTRAAQLKRHVRTFLDDLARRGRLGGDGKCVLIGHSMGGLDARYAVSRLGLADRVRAVVTVATPHRGSPFADWTLRHLDDRLGVYRRLAAWGLDVTAATDLTCRACCGLNDVMPDASGVRYLSVSAACSRLRCTPLLYVPHRIIEAAEGPNDGLVSVASARWGEDLGTWNADHFHTINKRFFGTDWLAPRHARTGDIAPLYLKILDELVTRGLVEPP